MGVIIHIYMKSRNIAIPAVYLFLIKNNKVLMIRRAGTSYFNGYYSLPAGHVEAGELPLSCMIREAKEEIGITLLKKNVEMVHSQYRTKNDETADRVNYFFKASTWSGEPKNMELHKCDDMSWFPLAKLPIKTVPEVRLALKCYSKKISYSEMPYNKKDLNPTQEKNAKR